MARLRTVGWETQKLGTSRSHGEDHPGGSSTAGGFDSATVGTINTAVPRSGAACLEVTGTGTGDRALTLGAVLGRAFYQRIGFRFSATPPAGGVRLLEFQTVGNAAVGRVRLATTDVLRLQTSAGTQVGSDSPVLSHDHWYRIELKAIVAASPTSSNGILEVRLYDDATGLMIWNESSSSADLASTAIDRACAGNIAAATITGSLFFDDWAINDDQGANQNEWPGNGKVVLLKPTSDNARVGWTAGAGATTSLFEAVNNFPPVGVATGSATDASQIKDATNNATDTYDANVAAYSTAVASGGGGLVSGDTVRLVQALARISNSTATLRNVGVNNLSNPTGSERTDSSQAAATAESLAGWYSMRNAVQYAPSVTLGTSPVVRVRKASATAETSTVDLMGLYVEYQPAFAYAVPLSESPALADSLVKAPRVSSAESVGLSDAFAKGAGPHPADTAGLADAIAKGPRPVIADSTTLLDAVQDAIALALVDAASLADSRDPTATFQRSATDSVGLADDSHRGPGLNPAENLTLLDALVRAAGIHFADTATPADSLATSQGLVQSIADTLALSDAVREALALALTELVAVGDATTHVATLARTLGDSAALADALVRSATVALAESIAVAEAQAKRVQLERADTTSLDDALTRLVGTTLALADAVALADATRRRNRNENAPWFVGTIDMEPIHLDSEIDLVR